MPLTEKRILPFPNRHDRLSRETQIQISALEVETTRILDAFQVEDALGDIQAKVWGEGEIYYTDFKEVSRRRAVPGVPEWQLFGSVLDKIKVGFVLQAEIPGVMARYERSVLGSYRSDGDDQGHYLLLGEAKCMSVRAEGSWIQTDVVVKPRWGNSYKVPFKYTPPDTFDLVINDYRLPTKNRVPRSKEDAMKRPLPKDELQYQIGHFRQQNKPIDVLVGVGGGYSARINVDTNGAQSAFREELARNIELRKKHKGLPSQMRDRIAPLLSSISSLSSQ